jgi:hypothetical protein
MEKYNDDDSNIADIPVYKSQHLQLDKIKKLISERKSFKIEDAENTSKVVHSVEKEIEEQGFKCRVYTSFRKAAIAATGAAWFSPILGVPGALGLGAAGIVAGIGIGIHTIATYDPDYEIEKNLFNNDITVYYKK